MYARKELDISWGDLGFAAARCLSQADAEGLESRLEEQWAPGQGLVTLSVRSGFHLMLGCLGLPRGSEVLVSAVTIPHMAQLLEHHGLVPVPVELDEVTLAPRVEVMASLITPRTRAVLVAHLYGGLVEMKPVVALARRHKLLVWEDCAQAFAGDGYRGSVGSDVVMFSFGTIKTATALGGGLLRVPDPALLQEMRSQQRGWARQRQGEYLQKVLRGAALKAVAHPALLGPMVRAVEAYGRSWDEVIMAASRGFPGADWVSKLEHRPSAALVALMARRVEQRGSAQLWERREQGAWLARQLPAASMPGQGAQRPTWWLFPVLAPQPEALIRELRQLGFDATSGGTSLMAVSDEARGASARAQEVMRHIVYIPLSARLRPREREALVQALLHHLATPYDQGPFGEEVACA